MGFFDKLKKITTNLFSGFTEDRRNCSCTHRSRLQRCRSRRWSPCGL